MQFLMEITEYCLLIDDHVVDVGGIGEGNTIRILRTNVNVVNESKHVPNRTKDRVYLNSTCFSLNLNKPALQAQKKKVGTKKLRLGQ